MKLWLLKPHNDLRLEGFDWQSPSPWRPWYDKAFGFVVRAETEDRARSLASEDAGDEGGAAWLDPELSMCVELISYGEEGVIIQDFASA